MAGYRIYRLDGAGRVSSGEWVEASDDQEALKRAGEQHRLAEVWQGNRFVGRIGSPDAAGR